MTTNVSGPGSTWTRNGMMRWRDRVGLCPLISYAMG
jgi:hypothetical protein